MARIFPSLNRIELAREADFMLGALRIRPSRREVEAAGVRHVLQRRVMQVLVALAHPTAEVVSHDELIRRCWGGLSVGEDAIGRCIGQLRRLAARWAEPPFEIATIAGVGYRLDAFGGEAAKAPLEAGAATGRRRPGLGRPAIWIGAAMAAAAGAAGLWLASRADAPEGPQPPTVAVTPFRLLAGDARAAGFAASVSDELVGLLNENGVRTVAGGAGGAGGAGDLTLAGTVYEDAGMTRIRVQLDDPRAKLTLWSTQVEGPSAKGGQLRDRVAGAAGEAIYAAFEPRAQDGLKVDPAAVALFIKAEAGVKSPQLLKEGEPVRAAQEATALAPDFAAARGLLALALVESAVLTSTPRAPAAAETRAIAEAQRAIRTSPAHADAAYEALNFIADWRAPADLVAHEDRILAALGKEPDFPFLNMRECRFLVNVGRARAALPYCQRALALRPLAEPLGWSYAAALYSAGQDDLARRELARVTPFHPEHLSNRAWNFEIEAFTGSAERAHEILHDPDRVPQAFSPQAVAALDAMLRARKSRNPAALAEAMALLWNAHREHRLASRYVGLSAAVLGRPDEAFAAFDGPASQYPEPFDIFQPAAAPLWGDLRFWRIAQRRGLVRYWQARKAWPDLCASSGGGVACDELAAAADG